MLLRFCFSIVSLCLSTMDLGWAQSNYPNRPIRFIVDSVPGGTTDLMARLGADALNQQGIAVSVETKAGATGGVASDYVMASATDGYTILAAPNGNLLIKAFLEKGSTFNPSKDLTPIFIASESPHLLVVPKSLGINDIAGLVALAKSKPGEVFYGSAGLGTQPHISISQLGKISGTQFSHIPYKGLGGAMTDLLAGRIQVLSSSLGTVRSYIKNGQVVPLAVSGNHRLSALPDVPTAAQAGIADWSMNVWFGFFGPKNMNPQAQKFLTEKLTTAFQDPKFKGKILDQGAETNTDSPQVISERLAAEFKVYTQLFKEGVITLE